MLYVFKEVNPSFKIKSFIMAINVFHPKDFVFSGEMHDFWEIVYVVSGSVIATGDERIYHLESGQMLFHKPMEFHRIRSADGTSPHLLILSFKTAGEGMEKYKECHISLNNEEQKNFEQTFTSCYDAILSYEQNNSDYPYKSHIAASMLELFLLGLTRNNKTVQSILTRDEKYFRQIVGVMKENCRENLSLEQIAKLCEMSVSNMKRVFRLFSDVGLSKYYLQLRMRYAMTLLDDDLSVTQVARIMNFSDVSYFHTVFKRETGMTPCSYKRNSNRVL